MSGLSGEGTAGPASGFTDMLALMANPARLQAMYAEFAAKQKAAEDAIALVGPAKDVLRLRDEAGKDRANASSILEQSKQQAAKLLADANGSAAATVQAAQEKSDNLIKLAESEKGVAAARLAEVTQAKADQVAQQAAIDARDKAVTASANDVAAREAKVSQREKDVGDRENNVVAVRDKLVAQLTEHAKTLKKV
jgi:hypothetical protein